MIFAVMREPRSRVTYCRHGRRTVGFIISAALVVLPLSGLGLGLVRQLDFFDVPANATQVAVRGQQTVISPPPPPPPLAYPSGPCDSLIPGLPGLSSELRAPDVRFLGSSVQGREIWAEYWGPPNPATSVVVVGQVHGNECSPAVLVEQIRQNPPVGYGIWLIPTLNPDGYAAYSRQNANGVDLNADGGAVSQPETQALFNIIAAVRPALTLHIHSPNGFVGAYPTGAQLATQLCLSISDLPSMRCASGGAGTRTERSRWFLWQGLQAFGGESLLVELRAVSDAEVPTAQPRPPTMSIGSVRSDAVRILAILEAHL